MVKRKRKQSWLNEHHQDPYVHRAKQAGYRSRAVYKLLEIQRRDRLFRPGLTVVDLGAAPGGWSQVASELVGASGQVIALDILPMAAIGGVTVLQGDFTEQECLDRLLAVLAGRSVDLVISDMAPNISGINSVDQPRSLHLVELAVDFADKALKPGGDLLVKVFQGAGVEALIKGLRADYQKVAMRKPPASRDRSREVYVLARHRLRR